MSRREVRGNNHARSGKNQQCCDEPQSALYYLPHGLTKTEGEDGDQTTALEEVELLDPTILHEFQVAYRLCILRIPRRQEPEDGVHHHEGDGPDDSRKP